MAIKTLFPKTPELYEINRVVGEDAGGSTLHTKADDIQAKTDNLPVNTTTRFDTVDTNVAAVKADTAANKVTLESGIYGLAAIKTEASAVRTDTEDIQAKVGTPAGVSVSADVAAVKAQTAAIEVDTQDLQTKVGTPAGVSVSADVAAVKVDTAANKVTLESGIYGLAAIKTQTGALETDTQDIQAKVGTPVGASVSADIATLQSSITNINNATRLSGGLPGLLELPEAGTTYYRAAIALFDGSGTPEAPDTDEFFFRVLDKAGAALTGVYFSTSTGTAIAAKVGGDFAGWYQMAYSVTGRGTAWVGIASSATKQGLTVEYGYKEATVTVIQPRPTQVVDYETTVATAAAVWDETKAAHITAGTFGKSVQDIESKVGTPVALGGTADLGSNLANLAGATFDTATDSSEAISNKVGAPAGASVSADIAAVKVDTAATKTVVESVTFGNAAIKTAVGGVQTTANTAVTDIGSLSTKVGTPAGVSVSADVAAIKAQTAAIEVDTTAIEVDTQDIQTKVGTPAGASLAADVAAVKTDTAANKVTLESGTFGLAAIKTQTGALETDTQDIQAKIGTVVNLNLGGATLGDNLEEIYNKVNAQVSHATTFMVTGTTGILNSGVTAAGTLEITLPSANVTIKQIKVTCSAVAIADYDFQIFEKTGNPATDLVYEAQELTETGANIGAGFEIVFRNNDTSPLAKVYVKFINQSATNSTFTVVLRGVRNAA